MLYTGITMWYTYILLCADQSLYTGITNNLTERFKKHQKGIGSRYTRSHKVVKILYSETFKTKGAALTRELQIKALTKAEKLTLVNTTTL